MDKLKIGIIGAGQVADTAHIPAYLCRRDLVEVAAICDTNEGNAALLAAKYGIPKVYASHADMLKNENLDAVSVCTGNRWHSSLTIDSLAAGYHVLCEKPPALNGAQAKEMSLAAAKAGKILTYNFQYRFSPQTHMMRELIVAGRLGEVYACRVRALRRRGIPGWGNFTNKNVQGGGVLIDLGIHFLDLALHLLGYPKIRYVCASAFDFIGKRPGIGLMGNWDHKAFNVEDGLFGYLQLENGSVIHIETAFALNMKEEKIMNVLLYGDKAGGSVFPPELYGEDGGNLSDITFPFVKSLDPADDRRRSVLHFIDCCIGKAEPVVTAQEGVMLQNIIDALYLSAQTGNPVMLED